MRTLLLLLCLAPQDQSLQARTLLESVVSGGKDAVFHQMEFETSSGTTGSFQVKRQKAWRVDTKKGDVEMTYLWDGKGFLNYMKKSNRFFRNPHEPAPMLIRNGGGLAELAYSDSADRLLKDAKSVTVKKDVLDGTACNLVSILRAEQNSENEQQFWIDEQKTLRRYLFRSIIKGKNYDTVFTYKPVDPATASDESFVFKVPADAKDLSAGK